MVAPQETGRLLVDVVVEGREHECGWEFLEVENPKMLQTASVFDQPIIRSVAC